MSAKFWHKDVRVNHLQKITRTFFIQKGQNLDVNLTLAPIVTVVTVETVVTLVTVVTVGAMPRPFGPRRGYIMTLQNISRW